MPHVQLPCVGPERVDLHYEDHGSGAPVVLVHGWPLDSACWERQVPVLLDAGFRVVCYDRRGFGGSSRPVSGYDFDTLAADLEALMGALDLREVALIGFSMGTGECARYLGRYGSPRVRAVAFLAALPPCLVTTPDNPGGVESGWLDALVTAISRDRHAFASTLLRDYYSADQLRADQLGEEVLLAGRNAIGLVPARILSACVRAWHADFRTDLGRIDVPALVLHGDDDRIFPIASTGLRLHERLAGSRWVAIEGGPHGLLWTHAEAVNRALLGFLERHAGDSVR